MIRNVQLLRRLMLDIEADAFQGVTMPGYDVPVVEAHLELLVEAGYLDAKSTSTLRERRWQINRLTWKGHELCELLRSDALWSAVLERIAGRAVPFELIERVAWKLREQELKAILQTT